MPVFMGIFLGVSQFVRWGKTNSTLIKNHVTGLAGGAITVGTEGVNKVKGLVNRGSSGGSGSYNESGTGVESARATARSSKRMEDVKTSADEGKTESSRMSETNRKTISNTSGKSDESRSNNINKTIKEGREKRNRDNSSNESGKSDGNIGKTVNDKKGSKENSSNTGAENKGKGSPK